MTDVKALKLVLDDYGSYLGMEKGCFVVKDKYGNSEKYPLFEKEIGEVVLKSGNMVSTGALASCGFWDIDVMILTQRGRPVATLKSLDDDSHVKTRLCQYEAYNGERGLYIAKQFVKSRIEGQNLVLQKYDLESHNLAFTKELDDMESVNLKSLRRKLVTYESKYTKRYFHQIFKLFPEKIRPIRRRKFKAYDGMNNLFNLGYEVLKWKVYRALVRAKLEPYLGFVHSVQFGKPSLVCDFQEIYRYLIEDFLIKYCQDLNKKDFITKTDDLTRKKKGKREYLNNHETRDFMQNLNEYFKSKVKIPRIMSGKKQILETLINEETLLFAKFLRKKCKEWKPRYVILYSIN